jgi:hypothetical protein
MAMRTTPSDSTTWPAQEHRVVFLHPARGFVTIVTVSPATGEEWASTLPIRDARIVADTCGGEALEALLPGKTDPIRIPRLTAAHLDQLRACGVMMTSKRALKKAG